MRLLAAAAGLAAALGGESLAARVAPAAGAWVDLMLLPVAWYGLQGRARWAMGVGCAAGLLHDAWFRVDAFGLEGFKKTLLGWSLASLASRFDLNQAVGRLASGMLLVVADQGLEWALRGLLDVAQGPWRPWALGMRALVNGVLVATVLAGLDRCLRRGEKSAARH